MGEKPVVGAEPRRVWPFVESPGEFANRLANAYLEFDGDWIAAVRYVLIERPAVLVMAEQLDSLMASWVEILDGPNVVGYEINADAMRALIYLLDVP